MADLQVHGIKMGNKYYFMHILPLHLQVVHQGRPV